MQKSNNPGIELLKLTMLSSEKTDVLIETFVKQAAILGKDISDDVYRNKLKTSLEQDDFLIPFAGKINEMFSEEEIQSLIQFYKSDLMKKLNTHSTEIYTPLYEAMSKLAQNV